MASQRSMSFMTAAGVWSSGMRIGSPPACWTARSYCGIARSAYSRSPECGMGIAMRAGMGSAHSLDSGQSFSLAMVTDFHRDHQDKNDGSGHHSHGYRKVAVSQGHIGMHASYSRHCNGADDSQQQTHCEAEQGPDKSDQQNA